MPPDEQGRNTMEVPSEDHGIPHVDGGANIERHEVLGERCAASELLTIRPDMGVRPAQTRAPRLRAPIVNEVRGDPTTRAAELVARLAAEDTQTTPTTLYRLFDADDRLLYIGIAGNPGRRFDQHRRDKPWWRQVVTTRLEHFDHRRDAENAETHAILNEEPVHNGVGSPVPIVPRHLRSAS